MGKKKKKSSPKKGPAVAAAKVEPKEEVPATTTTTNSITDNEQLDTTDPTAGTAIQESPCNKGGEKDEKVTGVEAEGAEQQLQVLIKDEEEKEQGPSSVSSETKLVGQEPPAPAIDIPMGCPVTDSTCSRLPCDEDSTIRMEVIAEPIEETIVVPGQEGGDDDECDGPTLLSGGLHEEELSSASTVLESFAIDHSPSTINIQSDGLHQQINAIPPPPLDDDDVGNDNSSDTKIDTQQQLLTSCSKTFVDPVESWGDDDMINDFLEDEKDCVNINNCRI